MATGSRSRTPVRATPPVRERAPLRPGGEPSQQPNRRKAQYNPAGNPLLWSKWVGYLFWAMAGYFSQSAKPPDVTLFHRIMLNPGSLKDWNRDLLTISWFFLWLTILVAIGGLILNAMQLRRKNDHLSIGLIVLMILTIVSMAITPPGNSIATFLSHL